MLLPWCLQVEQLNLLSDSNKLLREQKIKLEQQLEASTSRVRELEGEVQPLKENVKILTVQKDALVAEKAALKNEVLKMFTVPIRKDILELIWN